MANRACLSALYYVYIYKRMLCVYDVLTSGVLVEERPNALSEKISLGLAHVIVIVYVHVEIHQQH